MNVNPFSYLKEKLKGKVDKSGDTMTGDLTVDTGTSTDSVVVIGGSQNYGALRLKAGTTGKQGTIITAVLTANRNYVLPDNGGTLALTSDIPVTSLGGVSTMPNISTGGLFGFTLTQNAVVSGITLPAGLRCFGYCSSNIAHCTGIANGTELYMLRCVGGTWTVLDVKG